MKKNAFVLLLCSVLFMTAAHADPQDNDAEAKNIDVNVQIEGEKVTVDLTLAVPATQREVWAVLTDFEHMADFVSNVKESKVVSMSGDTLKIFQRGAATYGMVSFPFESTREIRLSPFDKIRSRLISGNMRMMEGITQLVDDGGQTRIIYHTDTVQENWIPPLLGKVFIEHELRKQFQEMRAEIVRRKRASASSIPARSSAGGI